MEMPPGAAPGARRRPRTRRGRNDGAAPRRALLDIHGSMRHRVLADYEAKVSHPTFGVPCRHLLAIPYESSVTLGQEESMLRH